MTKYVIGIDYGTLSARALLIEADSGKEVASCVYEYPHAIIAKDYFSGQTLPESYALQHPQDYLDALNRTINGVIEISKIKKEQVVGLGIDFTASTVVAVDENLTPLCLKKEFINSPHAYAKLWKHHGAEKQAEKINKVAIESGEKWLLRYGGKVSSEWYFPKVLETFEKDKNVYNNADNFLEAGDWLTSLITGRVARNACMVGFKAFWSKKDGFPKKSFWEKVDLDFANSFESKFKGEVIPVGACHGQIDERGAVLTGLSVGTAVAASVGDAHASMPAIGITDAGKIMLIVGTSACHIVLGEKDVQVSGICGSVDGGVIPDYVAFEAGQTCFGDAFEWVKNCAVPESYAISARENGQSIFEYLNLLAEKLKVGENRLVALDWFNGNRSPYADFELSGMMIGLTLSTKPEHIYRAVMEALAFGTRRITDIYKDSRVIVDEIITTGGIANKNPLLMQIMSDVLGVKIIVSEDRQSGARGSAIYASVAAGVYKTIKDAANAYCVSGGKTYYPIVENTKQYDKLYNEYLRLSKYFAESDGVMKRLKDI